jgi:hypothetical protein
MNAVPFDTLRLAQRLEAAGLAAPVAAGASEALAEAMSGAELATKSDIGALRSDLKAVEASLRTDMAAMRTELKGEIGGLRVELKSDMEILKRDMTIRLGGMMTLLLGLAIGAARLILVHP